MLYVYFNMVHFLEIIKDVYFDNVSVTNIILQVLMNQWE